MLIDPFISRVASGATLEELVFAPLASHDPELLVVDVGARNGMQIAPTLARHAALVGFEPNQDEYEKLSPHRTDAELAGIPLPRFKKESYHNCALWSSDAIQPFYITAGTGACTLMGRALDSMASRIWNDHQEQSYAQLHTDIRTSVAVQCRRLDDVMPSGRLIDYLKLDVEGAELETLKGAERFLARADVLFIKTEFSFVPYYENHPVLGHQHLFLHERGYRLIDLDLDHARYSRDKTSMPAMADRRLIYAGDAYFLPDPDRLSLVPEKLHRMGIIAIALGFHSLGVSLLRDAALLTADSVSEIERALSRIRPGRRLKNLWNRFPLAVAGGLANARLRWNSSRRTT